MSATPNVSIGAEGYVGIALETVQGTYEAPTKFFPIRSESLSWTQDTNWRRVIRGTVDPIGAIAGNGNVEGDIDTELLTDVLPYFLSCARGTLTKTGTPSATAGEPDTAPWTYEFIPTHGALAPNTMSVTVVRNGEAFGYVGCVVSSLSVSEDNAMGTSVFSVLGMREEPVAVPAAPAYSNDEPFGAGKWQIQVPTATQIFDADAFSFEADDSGEVQNRLKDELGAQFISFGERNTSISLDRDFQDRTEYDAFKNLTERSLTVNVSHSADRYCNFEMPVGIQDSNEVNLGGVGDLIRSSITYQGVHDPATGGAYRIEVGTDEDIAV